MKRRILPALAIAAVLLSPSIQAQKSRAFAVTSDARGSFAWNTIREIDLSSGEEIKTLYDKTLHAQFEIVGQDVKNTVNAQRGTSRMLPMAEGVAASAYDAKHNRLYYTTMRGTELRYFDLNSPTGKVVYNQAQPLFDGNRFNEANVITRMTFASDGFGYALTNDGKNLVRFSTDQKPVITNLGELIDGKKNGTLSVHNLCSSWGGDMVGDAFGNLYLVSMHNNVFKINSQTRIADHIGSIKGLPTGFTSNGMAVDDNGEVLLSSANIVTTYYRLNMSTLEALPLKSGTGDKVYNASDLASSNLLFQSKAIPVLPVSEIMGNEEVSVYPNPVTNKVLTLKFDKLPVGKYNLTLMDASGKNILARTVVVNGYGQVERVSLPSSASGMYMIKLSGNSKKIVYNNKIVVQ